MKVLSVMLFFIVLITLLMKWGSYRLNREGKQHLGLFIDNVAAVTKLPVTEVTIEPPNPILRYIDYCFGKQGRKHIKLVRLTQEGKFRLKPNPDSEKGWLLITAEQFVNTKEPDFFWLAKIKLNAFAWIKGWDYHINNQSNMCWKFNSLFKLVDENDIKLRLGAMTRYLAEIPWFPWAILYNQQITWKPVDSDSVQATLTNGALSVSVVFRINELGQITKVTANRYRSVNGAYELTSWQGSFGNYQRMGEINIPIDGEVKWLLEEGDFSYARLKITSIDTNHERNAH